MAATQVLLGLGANLGDPVGQLRLAVERLGRLLAVEAVSSLYRTEPVGFREQPDFFNLVCAGSTRLPPRELMRRILRLEEDLGRARTFANAPRLIDVDLLAYGDRVIGTAELELPHPRLHERGFVLVPLREVAPGWRHPRLGLTAAEMLERLGPQERVERWGALFDPAG